MSELALFEPWAEIANRDPVWGIDPSTHRFALSVVLPVGAESRLFTVCAEMEPGGPGERRLSGSYARMKRLFRATVEEFGVPIYAVIEQPFGRNVHPQSYYFVAAGLLALGQAMGSGGIIDTMDPSSWKRIAWGEGRGGARKPELLRLARSVGYGGQCSTCGAAGSVCERRPASDDLVHDEADSVGIAVAAARHWALKGSAV